MFTRNRAIFVSPALLAFGMAALTVYAQDQANPNQTQPVQTQPGPNQPGQTQPVQIQPGQTQPGQTQPVQVQPGQRQPYQVNMNPGLMEQGRLGRNGKQDVDLFLIPCLINANNGEVTLANIATQRAQSNDVKQFAQDMIKDHSAAAKQFEQLRANLNQQLHPQNPSNTPVAAALFEINQEIEQTCLNNAQRELEQLSGNDFDRAYVGKQIGMHSQLASVLSVLKNRVQSPEFKKAIEETSQVVDRHLEHAKKITKELQQQSGSSTTTREQQSGGNATTR
jgi:putative membrane protein